MFTEAYEYGFQAALEKVGVRLDTAGQAAGANTSKAFKVKFTKSVDNPARLSPFSHKKLLSSPKRSGPTGLNLTKPTPNPSVIGAKL